MASTDDDGIDRDGQIVAFPADSGYEYRLAWVEHSDAKSILDLGTVEEDHPYWLVTFMDDREPLPIGVTPESFVALPPVPLSQDHVVLPASAQQWKTLTEADGGQIVALPNLDRGHETGDHRLGLVTRTSRDDDGGRYHTVSAVNQSWSVAIHRDNVQDVRVVPTTLTRAEVVSLSRDSRLRHEQHRSEPQVQATTSGSDRTRAMALVLGL